MEKLKSNINIEENLKLLDRDIKTFNSYIKNKDGTDSNIHIGYHIKKDGSRLYEQEYTYVFGFVENVAIACLYEYTDNNVLSKIKQFHIDKNGERIYENTFSRVHNFCNGYAIVILENEFWETSVIDKHGDIVKKFDYIDIFNSSVGNGKYFICVDDNCNIYHCDMLNDFKKYYSFDLNSSEKLKKIKVSGDDFFEGKLRDGKIIYISPNSPFPLKRIDFFNITTSAGINKWVNSSDGIKHIDRQIAIIDKKYILDSNFLVSEFHLLSDYEKDLDVLYDESLIKFLKAKKIIK